MYIGASVGIIWSVLKTIGKIKIQIIGGRYSNIFHLVFFSSHKKNAGTSIIKASKAKGSVSSILNRELTEQLIGKTLDESKKMDENELLDEINKILFAHKICLKGNALGDEFGTSIIAKEAELVDHDIKEDAEKLSQELGGLL